MICLIQRVNDAEVKIKDISYSKIEKGLLVFLGIEKSDGNEDLDYILKKTLGLRIFSDQKNKMNLSVQDIKGQILVVSQFTLCADISKGKRPSYFNAASPQKAEKLYLDFIKKIEDLQLDVKTGKFGESMEVKINNNGPVTIIINSKEKLWKLE